MFNAILCLIVGYAAIAAGVYAIQRSRGADRDSARKAGLSWGRTLLSAIRRLIV